MCFVIGVIHIPRSFIPTKEFFYAASFTFVDCRKSGSFSGEERDLSRAARESALESMDDGVDGGAHWGKCFRDIARTKISDRANGFIQSAVSDSIVGRAGISIVSFYLSGGWFFLGLSRAATKTWTGIFLTKAKFDFI
jgi:hypothetical protein